MPDSQNSGRTIAAIAAIDAFLAVALGAFGAHGLEAMVTPDRLDTWHTAVLYQFMHVFGLFVLVMLGQTGFRSGLKAVAACFIAGTLLFSGSLYLLVLLDQPRLGMITPLGGLAFLAGWAWLAINFLKAGNRD